MLCKRMIVKRHYLPVETGQGQGNTGAAASHQARRFAHRPMSISTSSIRRSCKLTMFRQSLWTCLLSHYTVFVYTFLMLFPKILLRSTVFFCVLSFYLTSLLYILVHCRRIFIIKGYILARLFVSVDLKI